MINIKRSHPNKRRNCPPDISRANLGTTLGSRDPQHIRRWINAQNAGRAAAPKCEAVATSTGLRCQSCVRRGQNYCLRHLRGREAAAADIEITTRQLKVLGNPLIKGVAHSRAVNTMARVARAEIYRVWRIDPRGPAVDLLILSDHDERRVVEWLLNRHGIRLDKDLPNSDHRPTARCRDRLRWAAWRVISRAEAATPEFITKADNRVRAAVRDDTKFWVKVAKLGAENV